VPNSEKRLPEDTEYTRADLHTAAMERAYIAGLEEGAQTADLSWQRWKGDDHDLPVVECDVTACDNIAAAIRALKDPAHVRAAVAKLTDGEG